MRLEQFIKTLLLTILAYALTIVYYCYLIKGSGDLDSFRKAYGHLNYWIMVKGCST